MSNRYSYQFIIDSVYKGNKFKEVIRYWEKGIKSFKLIEELQNYH